MSAAEKFGVMPDIITTAKGITNATIPMGGVFVSDEIYEAFMSTEDAGPELSHGYTYSGHPLACAAGMATLSIYEDEGLLTRAQDLQNHWISSALGLQDHRHVIDIRAFALMGAIELAPHPDAPMRRGAALSAACYKRGLWARNIGDALVLSPPLIVTEAQITEIFDVISDALEAID